ncbi:MAG: hypothetical protein FWG83_05620 [Oscillospiraceae bacterium]|nr:hypothetical protein [Oscillospiraceae bacterium]
MKKFLMYLTMLAVVVMSTACVETGITPSNQNAESEEVLRVETENTRNDIFNEPKTETLTEAVALTDEEWFDLVLYGKIPISTTEEFERWGRLNEMYRTTSTAQNREEELMQIHRDTMNKVTDDPLETVLTEVVSSKIGVGDNIGLMNMIRYRFNLAQSHLITPANHLVRHPGGILRRVNDYRMYSVHRTDEGGLFYSFFVGEDGGAMYNTIYAVKRLERADMLSLSIGDDVSAVEAIDPATKLLPNIESRISWEQEIINFHSKHLLTDGILVVNYKKAGETWIIESIQFHEDFTIIGTGIYEGIVYDYSLNEGDYPQF